MKKIIIFLKYQFRYRMSSVYIILGMIIGYITLFNGVGIYKYIKNYTNDLRGNRYAYEANMIIASTEPFDVRKYLRETTCIVWMNYVDVYLDVIDVNSLITILLSTPEENNYHLVEGRLPNDDEIVNHEKVVAIGRGRKAATYLENGIRYILIQGEEYRVTGIIGTKGSDAQDYLIVTYYDCLGDGALRKIDKYDYELVLQSNLSDVYYNCESVASLALADGLDVNVSESMINISGMTIEEKKSLNMYAYMFGFTIIGCIMITDFWIFQRKRDIAILRVLGCSKKMIIRKQVGEMIFHMLFALLISMLIQIFFLHYIGLTYSLTLIGVMKVTILFVLLSIIIVVGTTGKVMKELPVYEINGKK